MTPPNVKSLLSCCCAVMLTWTASKATDAGAFFYAGFGPTACCGPYYAGYAPYSTAFYGVGYRGWWGASYASYSAPGCCGYSCGGCSTCGVSYGPCGVCCDACGLTSCSGCGIACTVGCDPGASTSSGSGGSNTPNQPYTPPATGPGNSTFESQQEDFSKPRTGNPPAAGGAGNVLPPGAGVDDDGGSIFSRETNKPPAEPAPPSADGEQQTIEQRQNLKPADAEPSEGGEHENRPPADENADVLPVEIDARIATGLAPQRSRVQYTVRFRPPHIARLDVTPGSRWIPVDIETRVAATR